jgi:hypothetical protein
MRLEEALLKEHAHRRSSILIIVRTSSNCQIVKFYKVSSMTLVIFVDDFFTQLAHSERPPKSLEQDP